MAVVFRLATLSDRTEARALVNSVSDELDAEWGGGWRTLITNERLADMLGSGRFRVLVGADNGTIRGFALGEHLDDGRWQIILAVIDKTLSAQQRLTQFLNAMKWLAGQLPGSTPFMGHLRTGQRIDNYLITRLPDRQQIADGVVEYNTTAQAILDDL